LDEIKKIRENTEQVEEKTLEAQPVKTENMDETDLKIIETLGNGNGSTTSEIYNFMGISGNSFKKHADKLMKMSLINFRVGKVYRQKAIYYFLTDGGEKIFESNFQRPIETVKFDIQTIKNFIINYFTLKTYRLTEDKPENIIFEKDGKRIIVNIEFELNKEKFRNKIENLVKNGHTYFVCVNEKIKNFIVRESSKYCFKKNISTLIVYVTTIKEMEEGKDFKKIEFQLG